MSMLTSLARAYERMPNKPPFGFSAENIGILVSLKANGELAEVTDIRNVATSTLIRPVSIIVPQPTKRTAAILPNFLWDNTAYALGISSKPDPRLSQKHAAFLQLHEQILAHVNDEGLRAFLLFLRAWSPDQFKSPSWKEEYKDLNIIFILDKDRPTKLFLHARPIVETLVAEMKYNKGRPLRVCLVTGKMDSIARIHPSIKGVRGAHGAGAALISFNFDACASYGHEQGDNAQIGEVATFAYTTALNNFLSRESQNVAQVGDVSVVFWAESNDTQTDSITEVNFGRMINPPEDRERVTEMKASVIGSHAELREKINFIRLGLVPHELKSVLDSNVPFSILALAPNNGRLSVRFYSQNNFSVLAEHYNAYCSDTAIEPRPLHHREFALWKLASRFGPGRRDTNGKLNFNLGSVSPQILSAFLQAVFSGARFPRSLLSTLIMRVKNDGILDPLRVSLIKAIITRYRRIVEGIQEDCLVQANPNDTDPARQLGHLFAIIEHAQRSALGDLLSSTVANQYLGAAASTPARIMPVLLMAAQTRHIARLKRGRSDAIWIKESENPTDLARRVGISIERDIALILRKLEGGIPSQLSLEEQGLFLIGYYQERWGGGRVK